MKAAGTRANFPGFIQPALAVSGKPPSRGDWIHEVKFDGYRVQVHVAVETVKILTRRGHDWTSQFAKIAYESWHIKARSAIIDGEVVVHAADGTTDFSALQKAIRAKSSSGLALYAFDLLYLNGKDLRMLPLEERKRLLKRTIRGTEILFSESFESDGSAMFKAACQMGLEGIVSKRLGSKYHSDRTNDWIKTTCRQRETLSIVGYALKGNRFDGLYLGRTEKDKLVYAGKVDHGFDRQSIADLRKRLEPLKQRTQAYAVKIDMPKAVWVKPVLLAEVEYRAKSAAGKVRHPAFKGLREDLG